MATDINFDEFEGTLNPIGLRNMVGRQDHRPIKVYVYQKGVEYPFSFVGTGIYSISKTLGIPEKAAGLLLIAKISEVLGSVEDETVKHELTSRIKHLQATLAPKRVQRCIQCGHSFYPKRKLQQRCSVCLSRR
jgi:hypothetical protein